jgi:hypothetical protein
MPLDKPYNISVLLLISLLALTGCKDSPAPTASPVRSAADVGEMGKGPANESSAQLPGDGQAVDGAAGKIADHFGTAVIRGVVRFEGQRPRPKPIKMQGDHACNADGATVPSPGTVVSKSGGVPHVFVFIRKGIDGEYAPPEESVQLDQKGCMYVPHVLGIQVGQPLRVTNSDPTTHNIHGLFQKNERFNINQAGQGVFTIKKFTRPEVMAKFKCDVHGWMTAYAGVLRHPFFSVTDAEGVFEVSRLPPGDYVLEAWHELWGTLQQDVTVTEGQTLDVRFAYSREKKTAGGAGG